MSARFDGFSITTQVAAVVIDFDNIDEWAPLLQVALSSCVPATFPTTLREADPEYIEDARDDLFKVGGRDAVIEATIAWLRAVEIACYHGTRLTSAEIESVRSIGLIPLTAQSRRERLVRALSQHPEWAKECSRLDDVLYRMGAGCGAGKREGQVHLTLSRGGLSRGFNHYLHYGAEFDYHAAHDLLGDEGQELLGNDGDPLLIRVANPGVVALNAAHPYFSLDELRKRGDVPNIVGEFLQAWAFQHKKPAFQPGTQHIDCGMIFYETVPAEWIIEFAKWEGSIE